MSGGLRPAALFRARLVGPGISLDRVSENMFPATYVPSGIFWKCYLEELSVGCPAEVAHPCANWKELLSCAPLDGSRVPEVLGSYPAQVVPERWSE